jgi:hypothetical protein
MFGLSRGVTLGIAAAILALVLLIAGPPACNKMRSMAAQARLQEEQMDAQGNSARDAIATQGAASARERASEDLTRTNEEEIRNAQGASDPVNPAARDAGLRALCRRAAYRDSERCRMFRTDPAGLGAGSAPGRDPGR